MRGQDTKWNIFILVYIISAGLSWVQAHTRKSVVELGGAAITGPRDAETTFGSRLCLFTSDLHHLLPINSEVSLLFPPLFGRLAIAFHLILIVVIVSIRTAIV
jgi:hypothetical protein